MKAKLTVLTNLRSSVLARFLAVTLILVSVFPLNTATTNAYQYPSTVKQKIQSKIFIAPKAVKRASLTTSLRSSNVISGQSGVNGVCGEYSIDRNETISVNIISGNGHVDAQNSITSGGSSPVNNFVTIAAVPEGPNPVTYIVRNGDCPAFNFVPAAGYQFSYYVFNGGSPQNSNYLKSPRVLGSYTLDVAFSEINCTAIYNASAHGSLSVKNLNNLTSYTSTFICGQNPDLITAVPDANYHFVKWDDNNSTTNPRQDISVSSAINTSALFAIDTHTLTYSADASKGTIYGSASQTVDYGANGTQVTATPNTGYHFVKWSDDVVTASRTDLNVTQDLSVNAIFAIDTHTVIYIAGANGSIRGVASQTVDYDASGTLVSAIPNPGYHFVEWSDHSTSSSRTETHVIVDLSYSVSFAPNPPGVFYIYYRNGGGYGSSPAGPNSYVAGNSFRLPNNSYSRVGYDFVGWSDDASKRVYQPEDIFVTSGGDVSFTALWSIHHHTITYKGGDGATGVGPSAPNSFQYGDNVELPECKDSCFVKPGYVFMGWNDEFAFYKAGDTYQIPDSDVVLTAVWTIENAAVVVTPGVPKVIIKKLPEYKTSYLAWGSARLNMSFSDITSYIYHLKITHDYGTSVRLIDKVLKSVSNIFDVKVTNDGLDITTINGWTGKLILPVIAVQNSEEKEILVGAVENPGPVKSPIINLSNVNKELITWKKDGSQVVGYVVKNGSKVICKTSKLSCVVNNGTSGKLNIRIQAIGRQSTSSTLAKPAVTPNNFVVQFATASYALTPASKKILDNLVRIANLIGAKKFEISGHTDSAGNSAMNQKLSVNRAKSVQKYLKGKIKSSTFTLTGFASTVAVATNATNSGKAANRRVEIKIS